MKIYNEIKKEIKYLFWLFIIFAYGLMVCDISNRQANWDYGFQNWEYNIENAANSLLLTPYDENH